MWRGRALPPSTGSTARNISENTPLSFPPDQKPACDTTPRWMHVEYTERTTQHTHTATQTTPREHSWRVCGRTSRCRPMSAVSLYRLSRYIRRKTCCVCRCAWRTASPRRLGSLSLPCLLPEEEGLSADGKCGSASHLLPPLCSIQSCFICFSLFVSWTLIILIRLMNCRTSKAKHEFSAVCASLEDLISFLNK